MGRIFPYAWKPGVRNFHGSPTVSHVSYYRKSTPSSRTTSPAWTPTAGVSAPIRTTPDNHTDLESSILGKERNKILGYAQLFSYKKYLLNRIDCDCLNANIVIDFKVRPVVSVSETVL